MKKFLTLSNILGCCAALLGLVAILLIFAPSISATGFVTTVTQSGLKTTFGYSERSFTVFKFSFMNFLTYVLVIVGIVFTVLSAMGKLGKISGYVAMACFLIAGIFFFCARVFTVPASGSMDGWSLGAGAIVSGILSIISAALVAVKTFVIKE